MLEPICLTAPENIQVLLNAGAYVMARTLDGFTPLHNAASEGTPENIRVLLDAGADVTARNIWSWTPLHHAASESTPENIRVLLNAGVDVMVRDKFDRTPLHNAARFNDKIVVIEVLLEAGADPKAITENGKTPWDFAKKNEKLKGTKSLWALNDARYN